MKRLVSFLCLITAVSAFAQMPKTLNYQGTLATGSTPVPDGNYNVTFRLYTASSGGSAVWAEAQLVTTRNGVFNAVLGKIVNLPASFNTSYWMSLQVGADPELSPRLEITGVSYSMHSLVADSANKVADGSVTASKIADDAVSSPKILNQSIVGADIALGTITAENILDEPGVSSLTSTGGTALDDGNIRYTLDSVDVTLPTSGVVVVIATGYVALWHTTGTGSGVAVGLNSVPGSITLLSPGVIYAYVSSEHPTATQSIPFTCIRILSEVSGGTKRYYLNAQYLSGSSSLTNVAHTVLTAMYFPTLRGTISSSAGDLRILNSAIAPDGSLSGNR